MKNILIIILSISLLFSCKNDKFEKKGFQVSEISEDENGKKVVGLQIDSLKFATQPIDVLLTKNPEHRLIPIFKLNFDKKGNPFTGSIDYFQNWNDEVYAAESETATINDGNNWNHNFMPGFSAINGYNLVNVAHFNQDSQSQNNFFEKPVLIRTLYFPAFSKDTLNFQPVKRNFYMVSVYDEDTNKDGYLNVKDLRRMYSFDIEGKEPKNIVPKDHSVMSSEYDAGNDLMYILTKFDQNNNGKMELTEPTHIFWINLKDREKTGMIYGN
jgi:hypothetical protein